MDSSVFGEVLKEDRLDTHDEKDHLTLKILCGEKDWQSKKSVCFVVDID